MLQKEQNDLEIDDIKDGKTYRSELQQQLSEIKNLSVMYHLILITQL